MINQENQIDFLKLKKNLKKDFSNLKLVKIAILGDSSTQILHQALKGYGFEVGIDFLIYESDYNQISQEILNPDSGLFQFQPAFTILLHCVQNQYANFCTKEEKDRLSFADDYLKSIEALIKKLDSLDTQIIFNNFIELNDNVFGNFSNKVGHSFLFQIRKLNFELMQLSQKHHKLFLNDICSLSNQHGQNFSIDHKLYLSSDFAFSIDFFVLIAKNMVDIILPHLGRIKKCLILDLDNTIWGGEIGEDGLNNIQIGNIGIGKAYSEIQTWAKELKNRGIILAVCSKNTESIAKAPFIEHPEMVLRLDDISVFVANWNNKDENIKHIQTVLNIGFDSMVFLDDNQFERGLVRHAFPEICIPELPADPAEYLEYLKSLNLFETVSISSEDKKRTRLYQDEFKRVIHKQESKSEEEFFKNLNMASSVKNFDEYGIPRIAQLLQRSNQFNLRTIRYSEEELYKISYSEEYVPLYFNLSDTYGAYGLIAVVILKKLKESLFIDTWAMSCRILKRGMEEFIMNYIVDIARRNRYYKITGEIIPTAKNVIIKDLLLNFKFTSHDNNWVLNVDQWVEFPTAIKLNNN